MKAIESSPNVAQIESRLNKYPYLSKNTLPGCPDAKVFSILENIRKFPDRKTNPNFYHWYILMKQFSPSTLNKWISDQLYLDQDDSLIQEFVKLYSTKKESTQAIDSSGGDSPASKTQNSALIEHKIEITLKDITTEKMNSLRKLLEQYKAEMTEEDSSRLLKIVCRIDPNKLDEFDRQISKCVEYDEFFVKRKEMKGQKTIGPFLPQKNQ